MAQGNTLHEVDELEPRRGETVPMDYGEHERTYHLFLRLLVFGAGAFLVFLIGWMVWL